jgi:hypothetical protein
MGTTTTLLSRLRLPAYGLRHREVRSRKGALMSDLVSSDYVLARWAYSELPSNRYDRLNVPELKKKALERMPFDDLTDKEHSSLVQAWRRVRGAPDVIQGLTGISTFQLARWSREQLATVYVIPYMVRDIASDSLTHIIRVSFRLWIEAEPVRPFHQGHARYAAFGTPPRPMEDGPLTVGRNPEGLPLLLDGYHRAVRFWNASDPTATLAVYVPTTS